MARGVKIDCLPQRPRGGRNLTFLTYYHEKTFSIFASLRRIGLGRSSRRADDFSIYNSKSNHIPGHHDHAKCHHDDFRHDHDHQQCHDSDAPFAFGGRLHYPEW